MTSRATPWLLASPALMLLLGLLVCPIVLLVRVSLYEPARGHGFFVTGTWTVANYRAMTDGYGLGILGWTVLFAVLVAGMTLLLAYPVALLLRSVAGPLRGMLLGAVLLPKLAIVLVILFALQQLLGSRIRGPAGALIGEVALILPYAVLVLFAEMQRIDPTWEAAARGLGATPLQVFRRITLPLSVPGLLLAGELALVWGMGGFLGPLFLAGPQQTTLSVEIHRQAFEYGRWPRAAAGAVLLVGAVALLLGLSGWVRRVLGTRGP